MHRHTVTTDVKGFHSTVSVDRVTRASEAQRTLEATTQAGSTTKIGHQPSVDDGENSREYVVDEIDVHRREYVKNLYKLRWYEYTQRDDTWEPADRIPQHLVARYHERERRTQQMTGLP